MEHTPILTTFRFALFSLSFCIVASLSGCSIPDTQATTTAKDAANNVEKAAIILDSWTGNHDVLVDANSLLRNALILDPNSIEARHEMARYHIMNGDLISAENVLNEALELNPDDANTYVLLGHLYHLQEDNDKALSVLDKAKALGTDNLWLYMNKADIYEDLFREDEAAKMQEMVLNHPDATIKMRRNASGSLANYYRKQNDMQKAKEYYDIHISIDPSNAYAYKQRADLLSCVEHDFNAAKDDIDKAQSLMDNVDMRRTRGNVYWIEWQHRYSNGDSTASLMYDLARDHTFEHAIALVANNCMNNQTWRNFGNTAGEAFDAGIPFNPNDIAKFYQATGQYDKVKRLSEQYDIADKYKTEILTYEQYQEEMCIMYGKC